MTTETRFTRQLADYHTVSDVRMMFMLQQHEHFHASIPHLCPMIVRKAHTIYRQCTMSSAVALQVYVTQYTQPSTLYS